MDKPIKNFYILAEKIKSKHRRHQHRLANKKFIFEVPIYRDLIQEIKKPSNDGFFIYVINK